MHKGAHLDERLHIILYDYYVSNNKRHITYYRYRSSNNVAYDLHKNNRQK